MKEGHTTNVIRFDIKLSEDDLYALESILEVTHRTRASFGEALVKLALRAHLNHDTFIDIEKLGAVCKRKKLTKLT